MNNYEQKYKMALKRAKELISRCIDDRDRRTKVYRVEDIESIFPELKESEDERIKREILELVSIAGNGNQFEEIKDWLEKKEQMLDPNKVIEWINDQACLGWIEDVEVDKFVDKFKKRFSNKC